jgi:hypothetical protein
VYSRWSRGRQVIYFVSSQQGNYSKRPGCSEASSGSRKLLRPTPTRPLESSTSDGKFFGRTPYSVTVYQVEQSCAIKQIRAGVLLVLVRLFPEMQFN